LIELYPFQETLIGQLRSAFAKGSRRVLLVSPTGSGKTVMFAYLVTRMAERNIRSNIMVHRQELLDQVAKTLDAFEAEHGYIAAGEIYDPAESLTHISSVFTLARRLGSAPVPTYGICDEAHHCIDGSTWGSCVAYWTKVNPEFRLIGVTATPERLSGEGLGTIFDTMIVGPGVAELIALGFLSKYKMFAPAQQLDTSSLRIRAGEFKTDDAEGLMNRPSITGNAVAHYRKYLNGAPAVAFCVSRKHAAQVAEDFRASGFRSASIDGTMTKPDRKAMVREFANGQLNVMTSCQLINEGFDCPGMHGAILLSPTQSLAKCLQEYGRTLRVAPGKEFAYILDHVGNSARHGLPDEQREWILHSGKRDKKKRDVDDIAIRQCPVCGAVSTATAVKCCECGHVFEVKARKIDEVEGELEEITMWRAQWQKKRDQGQAESIEALVELGKRRGMKNPHGWARHVWQARERKRA